MVTGRQRVLLTGGTGFVGGALLRRLLADGREVLALHGRRRPDLVHDQLEWRPFDLVGSNVKTLEAELAGQGLGLCYHTAWYTNHEDYLTAEVNRDWLAASQRLADAFAAAGGDRFVGLGTCIEYDTSGGRCSEALTPLRPQTLYARSKLDLLRALEATSGNFAWARIFFVYGPGDRAGRLVPQLIKRLASGEATGPAFGGLRRDYVHVDDLAGQLAAIGASAVNGPINTGSGNAVAIADFYAVAAELIGRPDLALINDRADPGQPPLIEADLARLRRSIGAFPVRSLHDGLAPLMAAAR